MDIALHALGIGSGAQRHVIDAVARAAEAAGFSTLWAGEHVVMVDAPQSRYPYADDGRIAVPADSDWLDPMIALSFAAAVTSRIRLATGVLLLAEHSPVVIAKQAASLDVLSGGRFTLGVGAGWSREEFDALGCRSSGGVGAWRSTCRRCVSCGARTWRPWPVSSCRSTVFASIPSRCGNARSRSCSAATAMWPSIAPRTPHPDLGPALEELGVDELVLVDSPPDYLALVDQWITRVARRWGV